MTKSKFKKTALVTGGAGFIGSNLVDKLIELGWKVKVIDNLSTGKKENINSRAKFHKLDICYLNKIKPHFQGVDYVFHLAALPGVQPSILDPITSNEVNLSGTLNILIASRDARVKRVIYSSSSSVYGNQTKLPVIETMIPNPISPYAVQKYMGELYCKLFSKIYNLSTVCLRYFNVYGKRQSLKGAYSPVIPRFIEQKRTNRPMTIVGNGRQRRDFTNVLDVVRANILAAKSSKAGRGESINIGRGQNYSINELAKIIGGRTIRIPSRLEPKESLSDNYLARKLLDWQPKIDLAKWIKEYKKEIDL